MTELLGRRTELDTVDALLSRARSGRSGALVLRGEAGIGKTALLETARLAAEASGFRVESSVGAESEAQFAFAGLHQLCAPLLDRVGSLPAPQQAALGVAFGQSSGETPDRFLVGLATLNLLAEVAEEGPLLCLIDDAQWLDQASAQVLAFVARRLAAEHIALVFAVRDPLGDSEARVLPAVDGLPELCLGGLDEASARALLASALTAPLDDRVLEQIIAESRGNPLALLELPLSVQSVQWAGGFGLPPLDVPRRVEESFRRRVGRSSGGDAAAAPCRRGRAHRRCGAAVARGGPSRGRRGSQSAMRNRRDWWRSTRRCGSGILWLARRSTGMRRHRIGAERMEHWPLPPIPTRTRTAAPGTARRRCWAPTRGPPRSWRAQPPGSAPATDWPPRRRSWSTRPC